MGLAVVVVVVVGAAVVVVVVVVVVPGKVREDHPRRTVLVSSELHVAFRQQVREPGIAVVHVSLRPGMNHGVTVGRFRVAVVTEQGDAESALRVGRKVPHSAAV